MKKVRNEIHTTDANALTLEGCWSYSPKTDSWEYVLWVERGAFHTQDEYGEEHQHSSPLPIVGLAPTLIEGTTPDNYQDRLAFARAEQGWGF
jgi:hypothetical protein